MLKINVAEEEHFDDETSEFFCSGGFELEFEHSLISLSKWESFHQKPFLDKADKTPEEIASYVECMLLTPNPPEDFIKQLTDSNVAKINAYIASDQSATTFGEMPDHRGPREVITSELIYYWLVAFNIPFEVETWHLNRLFALIRICNVKNSKPQKMSRAEAAQRRHALNEKRRAELGTNG